MLGKRPRSPSPRPDCCSWNLAGPTAYCTDRKHTLLYMLPTLSLACNATRNKRLPTFSQQPPIVPSHLFRPRLSGEKVHVNFQFFTICHQSTMYTRWWCSIAATHAIDMINASSTNKRGKIMYTLGADRSCGLSRSFRSRTHARTSSRLSIPAGVSSNSTCSKLVICGNPRATVWSLTASMRAWWARDKEAGQLCMCGRGIIILVNP